MIALKKSLNAGTTHQRLHRGTHTRGCLQVQKRTEYRKCALVVFYRFSRDGKVRSYRTTYLFGDGSTVPTWVDATRTLTLRVVISCDKICDRVNFTGAYSLILINILNLKLVITIATLDNIITPESILQNVDLYFVSTLLQFQIYRALCQAAGQYVPGDHTKPLHKCDIYRSKEAGNILKQLMEKGSSQSWRDVLFQATGESRLDGSALREYFRPLEDWLRNENLRTGEFVGWLYDGDYCKQSIETAGLQVYGGFYNGGNLLFANFLILILSFVVIFKMR